MTLPFLTRQQVRQVDQLAIEHYGLTGLQLMENAGRGLADVLCDLGAAASGGPVVVCCGKGNNAGDGFVLARHLDLRRIAVQLVLLVDPSELRGDALANYEVARRSDIPMHVLSPDFLDAQLDRLLATGGWIVDALLGTGASGPPRPPLNRAIAAINRASRPVLAVDLPSGLDADTGRPAEPTVRADHTCTFVAAKAGFLQQAAAPFVGELHVLDVGAPRVLVERLLSEVHATAATTAERL